MWNNTSGKCKIFVTVGDEGASLIVELIETEKEQN